MQHQGKPVSKNNSGNSNIKWWILAGVLAFLAVCAFIGVTLWLGLNFEDINERTVVNKKELSNEDIPDNKQVLFGASSQKSGEETTRRSQRDGNKGEKNKNGDSIINTTSTTETPCDKEIEHAVVEEVSKEQAETITTISKESQTLGSPLYPQPIPETPPFVPISPEEEPETSTLIISTLKSVPISKIPDKKRNSTFIQTLVTTVHDPVTLTTTPVTTEKVSEIVNHSLIKEVEEEEETPDFLDSFFNTPKEEYSKPTTFEDDIASVFLGESDKDVKKFDLSDVVNEKGEHFLPHIFEYPTDRYHPGPELHEYAEIKGEPVLRHSGEVFEDGIDREGLPSLDQESIFYTPGVPERYDGEDPDIAENPFTSFLQNKLQDLYSWLSTDEDLTGKQKSVSGDNSSYSEDLITLVLALNESMNTGNSSILLGKLKEMYYNESKINITDPAVLNNSSSLVSFGLLAFDLLLLKNVQNIAWEEEKVSSEEMMKDPEVLALNALFMSPEKVRQYQVSDIGFFYTF
ncbi:hypothetical protein L9F63_007794 [Diploptera punctata]|uniref:Uncharacterized protein n=1 Tax=Diploptera punctata TaxID=6984 RepID=A0AAD7Z709_DIPPU|nr:hypothetical protein L9F63_007794 [Diploptera punctata]